MAERTQDYPPLREACRRLDLDNRTSSESIVMLSNRATARRFSGTRTGFCNTTDRRHTLILGWHEVLPFPTPPRCTP